MAKSRCYNHTSVNLDTWEFEVQKGSLNLNWIWSGNFEIEKENFRIKWRRGGERKYYEDKNKYKNIIKYIISVLGFECVHLTQVKLIKRFKFKFGFQNKKKTK
jgi:hypothetical protein